MTDYALQQIAEARQSLNDHQTDGAGCCLTCGRPAPCGVRNAAEQTHERYMSWLNPQPAVGTDHHFDHVGMIVRPYVENLGRSHPDVPAV